MPADDAAKVVQLGDADIAFGLDYPASPVPQTPDIEVVRIAGERFGIASAPGSALPPRLRRPELAQQRWILPAESTNYGRALFVACRRAGFEPRIAHVVEDSTVSLAMAAQGLGITTITPLILNLVPTPDIVRHELADDVRRDLVFIRRRTSQPRPAVTAVAEIIRELVARSTVG